MRIVWDDTENRFLAELTPGEQWRTDMETIKVVGFKTTGPPSWQWYTSKASILNKLREKIKDISITEVALEKYKILNQQEQQKAALKKQFQTAQKIAEKSEKFPELETYFDAEITVTCLVVKPAQTVFVSSFIRPEPPKERCLLCDEPLYWPLDGPTFCAWCEVENRT